MPKWRLSTEAERDFVDISEYTVEAWGVIQARAYIAAIEAALDRIADFPGLGLRLEGSAAFRGARHERHHIFYVQNGDDILVVRVLHVSRDPLSWPTDEGAS